MKKVALLVMLALGMSLSARGESPPPNARELWKTVIGGRLHIPGKPRELDVWFAPEKDSACLAEVKEVLELAETYGKDSYHSRKRSVKEAAGIVDYLRGLNAAKSPCFQIASGAYLVAAVWMSDLYSFSMARSMFTTGCPDRANNCGHGPPRNLYLLMLTKALIEAGAIVFDIPQEGSCKIDLEYICDPGDGLPEPASHRALIKLNPIAQLVDNAGKHYDAHPQDLATLYLHELDHLFRDKQVPLSYLRTHFQKENELGAIDWANYILMDETLSTILASTSEFADQQTNYFGERPNRIRDDFTMYQQKGPLVDLLEAIGMNGQLDLLSSNIAVNYVDFLRAAFLGGAGLNERARRDLTEIYRLLQKSFFSSRGEKTAATFFDTIDKSPLAPERHTIDFDPLPLDLQSWNRLFIKAPRGTVNEDDVLRGHMAFALQIGPFPPIPLYMWPAEMVMPIGNMLRHIESILSSLDTPSAVCPLFNQRLQDASVAPDSAHDPIKEYLGDTCVQVPGHPGGGENGGRPGGGENGGRPASPVGRP